jgi:ATP-dependent protease ClpP protease subunit
MNSHKKVTGEFLLKGKLEIDMADELATKVYEFAKNNKGSEIHMIINSEGGKTGAARVIRDCINTLRGKKHFCIGEVTGSGWCSSAALWVLQTFDLRLASPESRFMFHELRVKDFSGTITELREELRSLTNTNNQTSAILLDRSRATCKNDPKRKALTPRQLSDWMKGCDVVWTGNEAWRYGLIDKLVLPPRFR